YFQMFQHLKQYNTVSHVLGAEGTYKLGPSFSLQVRDSFSYLTGTFQPPSATTLIPGLGFPTSLNQAIVTPIAPQITNNSRMDAVYHKSRRTSFTIFGGYNRLDFLGKTGTGENLLNTTDINAGIEYNYRATEHTTVGFQYLFDNMSFGGSTTILTNGRTLVHSAFLSLAWQAAPSVTVTVFGGPQYLVPSNHPLQIGSLPGSGFMARSGSNQPWQTAGGATLTKQAQKTAFTVSAMRTTSDGGGLLTSVTSSSVDVGVRRHLMRKWDVSANVIASRADELGSQFAGGQIDSQSASFGVSRGLSENSSATLSYSASRDQSKGNVPFAANFTTNRITLNFSYNAKGIQLGR
ncbi:MAG: hypothetical protein ACREP9_14545, partial [Candidatus Dormibacteraceae bacterium]